MHNIMIIQEQYVKEISAKKVNLLVLSKADLLSWKQRWAWLNNNQHLISCSVFLLGCHGHSTSQREG